MSMTHFPRGLTTAAAGSTLGEYGAPDPTKWHTFFDDFDKYTAGDWVIQTTEAGGGSATEALADVDGGVLLITNDVADNDNDFFQWAGGAGATTETFKFEVGKRLIFKMRFAVNEVLQSDVVLGLQITDTTPLAVSDGVYFLKSDGAATTDFIVAKGSTLTTTSSVATLVNDTYVVLGFAYDGVDNIDIFVDDVRVGSSVTTNLPDDEELTISFGIQQGEATNAKTLSVDYIFVAKER